jgi:ferritin-like metal-binding protein YciE
VAPGKLDLIRGYLADAIAAEKAFEAQLRGFADQGDDDDVKAVFAAHADETRSQCERLTARLRDLGGDASALKDATGHAFGVGATAPQIGHIQEERTVQNLILAYTVETSEYAMYEVLGLLARQAGDDVTARLATEIQAEEMRTAQKVFHFLPTRSIIAYNMLTVSEVDTSVATKYREASWTTSGD